MTDSLRPRFRFRAPGWGWLLLAAAVPAIVAAAVSVWLPYHRGQQVLRMVESWGGRYYIGKDYIGRGRPETLRQLVGGGRLEQAVALGRVYHVELSGKNVTDAEIAHLSGLTNLGELSLSGTAVTDAGLAHLSTLTNLDVLNLSETAVTNAGLAHLSRLTSLYALDLNGTAVTDAGLAHLKGCSSLRLLFIADTAVTDAGLMHLSMLTNLRLVGLHNSGVTKTGREKLTRALPDCHILEVRGSTPPPGLTPRAPRGLPAVPARPGVTSSR